MKYLFRDLFDYLIIRQKGLFDDKYYLEKYPDVRKADIDPLWHFVKFGRRENRRFSSEHNIGKLEVTHRVMGEGIINHHLMQLIKRKVDGIRHQYQKAREKMLISVVVTAYNQEDYISECLDSILAQKGNFSLEVILGDDASTDGTRDILQKYVRNFPGIFFLFHEEKNMGLVKNIKRCLDVCHGDFVAFCEGDDYWIDEYKLKKQKDLLLKKTEFSMCFSAINIYFQDESYYSLHEGQQSIKSDRIFIDDLLTENVIMNFSCCFYRTKTISSLPKELFELDNAADWIFNICCAEIGPIGYINEVMSVYRIHKDGLWAGKSLVDNLREGLPKLDVYDALLEYRYHEKFREIKERVKAFLANNS